MADPDAFTTLPMPQEAGAPEPECTEFLLLAARATASAHAGWERLRLRLAAQDRLVKQGIAPIGPPDVPRRAADS